MSLIACGSIHEGHEWFSDDSWGRQEIFMWFGFIMWAILPIREGRCQDIDQVLLHEIIFFLSLFSSREVTFGVNCRLQLAGVMKIKRGNCEANLLYVETDFGTTDTTNKSFTVFFNKRKLARLITQNRDTFFPIFRKAWPSFFRVLQRVKFHRRVKISARWFR